MNKCSNLQRMVGAFALHVTASQAPQFIVDERDELGRRVFVPLGQFREKDGHILRVLDP